MIRTTLTAAALTIGAWTAPALGEISPSQCKMNRYGETTSVEKFPCDFRQSFGSVQVWSKTWNIEFPYQEQGKTFIRIN